MGKHDITDKEKIFRDAVGQKAEVAREELGAERAQIPNRMLCDLGLKFQEIDPALKHYSYLGSAAVHIFAHDLLNSLVFASQADPLILYRCPEPLAAKAFDDLLRRMKLTYGKGHGKLRSGF